MSEHKINEIEIPCSQERIKHYAQLAQTELFEKALEFIKLGEAKGLNARAALEMWCESADDAVMASINGACNEIGMDSDEHRFVVEAVDPVIPSIIEDVMRAVIGRLEAGGEDKGYALASSIHRFGLESQVDVDTQELAREHFYDGCKRISKRVGEEIAKVVTARVSQLAASSIEVDGWEGSSMYGEAALHVIAHLAIEYAMPPFDSDGMNVADMLSSICSAVCSEIEARECMDMRREAESAVVVDIATFRRDKSDDEAQH
jgi:hypothetical protein